ncbi:hypothetical protein pEaSNUABM13_00292 [Erwinia phage pEa_SNUABM_13]|nr:hypothetical protein pEaSNUABM13_00292 [Erwinia phage pEa_SNUABM_13]QYW03592.1 hypothetical protein pEaSNUABM34_00290 [Erwinia phage pEa_SNUABM_34]
MTSRKNEVKLTDAEVAAGARQILEMLVSMRLSAHHQDVGYETLYTDSLGETQGGWYVAFDSLSRTRLKESKAVSWRNVGMVSGDSLEDVLTTLRTLRRDMSNRVHAPTPEERERVLNLRDSNIRNALTKFHKGESLSDGELNLSIKHFQSLENALRVDELLQLAAPYITQNLNVLLGYKEARRRK